MAAVIQIGETKAYLDKWHWVSEDSVLEDVLNSMLDPNGPSGADPMPLTDEARRSAEELGGKLVSEDKWEKSYKRQKDVIY